MFDWAVIFDGVGSSIVGAIVGSIVTAVIAIPVSYKAGQSSMRQMQKAGDDAKQIQIGSINDR